MKSKLVTALISTAIAVFVWLYVVTVISPNSSKYFYDIEVGIQGSKLLEERELIIMSADISTVTLHLEGNRVDLNKLSNANIVVDVDVSEIFEAGTYDLKYTTTFGDLPNSAITVLSKEPGSVKVVVEEKLTKTVPLHIEYSGQVAENHRAEKNNITLSSEAVTITGPKSVVDKIAIARIDVSLEGRRESLNNRYPITLCDTNKEPVDAKGVVANMAEVKLSLPVVGVKEVPLVYTVKDGAGATEETCVIELPVKTIKISGSDALLEKVEEVDLGVIDLGTILKNSELKRDIILPDGIKNESGLRQATIKISFPDIVEKEFEITVVPIHSLPENYDIKLTNKTIKITVRGYKTDVEKLTQDDFTVTVDFSGAHWSENVETRYAEVTCDDPEVALLNSNKKYPIEAERILKTESVE